MSEIELLNGCGLIGHIWNGHMWNGHGFNFLKAILAEFVGCHRFETDVINIKANHANHFWNVNKQIAFRQKRKKTRNKSIIL